MSKTSIHNHLVSAMGEISLAMQSIENNPKLKGEGIGLVMRQYLSAAWKLIDSANWHTYGLEHE